MPDIQEERLKNYLDAEKRALESQEYMVDGQRNRRAELNQLNAGINSLLVGGAGDQSRPGSRVRRIILRDW
jgi:hypothetical protein